ncbi:EamA family transporter [Gordonia sp. CPCC 205515]|uniref:EamA family transporter n=1 Tax=Gordonia sp. CPCC 205515 TaxID=3140791 RepID=UPI003AF383D8
MTDTDPLFRDSVPQASRAAASGMVFALVSAISFGLSGPLARPLMDTGWSPGAVVIIRIGVGAVVLLPFAIRDMAALRGTGAWRMILRNPTTIVVYGVMGVAVAQFCYFSAVRTIPVGPALLIEYGGVIVVVLWMWAVHGQRPNRWIYGGIALCVVGLILVLDVFGAPVNLGGVLWAVGAMLGLATYFVVSASHHDGLPASVLAAGGMIVATVLLSLLAAVGLVPVQIGAATARFAGFDAPAWLTLLALAFITGGLAYLTGIAAARRLGARLASLVALLEVLAAIIWAAALLGQIPTWTQIVGGVLVIGGVLCARRSEPTQVVM